ncbi:MAG: hypothetical protein ABII23_03480 [bacterium]
MKNAAFISLCLVGVIWLAGMFSGLIKPFSSSIFGLVAICGIGYLYLRLTTQKQQSVQKPEIKE